MNQTSNTGNAPADDLDSKVFLEPTPDKYGLTEAAIYKVFTSGQDFSRSVFLWGLGVFFACVLSYAPSADKTDSFKLVSWLSLIYLLGFLGAITAIISGRRWFKKHKSFKKIMDEIKERYSISLSISGQSSTQSVSLPSAPSRTSSSTPPDSSYKLLEY